MRSLILLLGCALIPLCTNAQILFNPEVVVNASDINEATKREMTRLEEQLQMMLLNYAPNVGASLTPKQPIRIFVLINVKESQLSDYKADVELVMYRPIYGIEDESIVFIIGERDVTFTFNPQMSHTFLGRDIPDDRLSKIIFYYATLGTMYYYDSFSLYGGTPFLRYLDEHRATFQEAWQNNAGANVRSERRYAPEQYLSELQSAQGDQFREIWYLYHREALDSQVEDSYVRVLGVILDGLKRMRENNASMSFISLFSDTKKIEMRARLLEDKSAYSSSVRALAEELFPNITRTL